MLFIPTEAGYDWQLTRLRGLTTILTSQYSRGRVSMSRHDKREQIMQAAEKLFTSKRFHEITLDDIVREARIGKGTIYQYFKDKDDLFFQVAVAGFDELCALLRKQVPQEAPFREQLLEACGAISSFFRRRRQLFRMIQTEDARMPFSRGRMREQWIDKRRHLVESLGKILRKGQTEGLVRDDFPAETLANFLLGLLRTRGRDLEKEEESIDDALLLDLFFDGATQGASKSERTVAQRPPVDRKQA
jgi:TetR/AcrR family fatty acid metabolism transcriptional regulator